MQWGCRPPPDTCTPSLGRQPPRHRPANEVAGRYVFTLVCHGGQMYPSMQWGCTPLPPGHMHTLPGQTTLPDTGPQTKLREGMFLHLSVTGEMYPSMQWGCTPPPLDTYTPSLGRQPPGHTPPGRHPQDTHTNTSWADTPLGRHSP